MSVAPGSGAPGNGPQWSEMRALFEDTGIAFQLSANTPTFTDSCPGFQWAPLGLNPTALGHMCSDTDLLSLLLARAPSPPRTHRQCLERFSVVLTRVVVPASGG